MANGAGLLGPALQAIGASLMGSGDLSQTGALLPQFQQAQANRQMQGLRAQALEAQMAEAERKRAQDAATREAFAALPPNLFGAGERGAAIRTVAASDPALMRSLLLQASKPRTGSFEVDDFGRVFNKQTGQFVGGAGTGDNALVRRAREEAQFGKPGEGFRFRRQNGQIVLDDQGQPTLEPIPGGSQDPIRRPEFRKQANILGRLSRDLTSYRNALQQGRNRLSVSNRRRLGRLHTNVLLQLKNLEQLGVIAGPDLDLLQSQLLDPTAITTDEASLMEGVDALQNRVAADTEQFRQTFGATRRQLGFTPLQPVGQVQTSAGTNKGDPLQTGAAADTPTGNQPGQRVNPPQGSSLVSGANSFQAAFDRAAEGDFIIDRVSGRRVQKVNGQPVVVDSTADFSGFGMGGGG